MLTSQEKQSLREIVYSGVPAPIAVRIAKASDDISKLSDVEARAKIAEFEAAKKAKVEARIKQLQDSIA